MARGLVRVLFLAGLVAGLSVAAMPAWGDQFVTFDLNTATITFNSATDVMNITESVGSNFDVKLEDGVSILQGTRISDGNAFAFDLNLNLAKQGANNWSATGTLSFTDTNKATPAVVANVHSTDLKILPGNILFLTGPLSNVQPNTTILVNRGDPWQFVGLQPIAGAIVQSSTVSVPTPELFTNGTLITVKFGVPGGTLDNLFATDRRLSGAEVKGEIVPVPAPAAVVLGMIGLSLVGWRMRRYA